VDAYLGDASNWEPLNPTRWAVQDDDGSLRYGIITTDYSNLSGSRLGELSLIKARNYGDFVFEALVKSSDDLVQNPSADYDVVFGYQDPMNYYYMMFNAREINNELFRVVDGEREVVVSASGFAMPDNDYHKIKLVRAGDSITAYFDDVQIVQASDSTFSSGQVGVGGFNDASLWDDITVQGLHDADQNPRNGCVDINELIPFIGRWKQGLDGITMIEIMDGIMLYNTGQGCP
jgi:hypothetical protein